MKILYINLFIIIYIFYITIVYQNHSISLLFYPYQYVSLPIYFWDIIYKRNL